MKSYSANIALSLEEKTNQSVNHTTNCKKCSFKVVAIIRIFFSAIFKWKNSFHVAKPILSAVSAANSRQLHVHFLHVSSFAFTKQYKQYY